MQADPFAHIPVAAPQPAPQQQPTVIGGRRVIGSVAPAERRAEEDQALERQRVAMEAERVRLAQEAAALTAAKTQQDLQAGAIELEGEEAKRSRLQQMQGAASADLRRVIEKIDEVALDAADNGGLFETGFSGSVAGPFPGTAAYDLRRNIETIDANSAFSRLQQMRDSSPTGGALGQVTERELDLLKSSIANLDPNQSQGQFIQNLAQAKRAYLDMLERIEPGASREFANRPGIRFDESGEAFLTTLQGEDNRERVELPGFNQPPPSGGGGSPFLTGLAQGTGDIVQGIGDTIGIVNDPLAAMLAESLGYDSSQMQSSGTALREALGLPQSDNPIVRGINQFGSSALVGGLAARGAATLANPGVTQNVLATLGRTPIRDAAAGAGAGAGAAAGREIGGTPGEIAGLIAGGLGGYGAANTAVRAAAPRAPNALAQAAGRQQVDMLPADAGGPVARAVTTGTRASPLSVAPVASAAERQQRQFGEAVQRTAASQGEVVTTQQAGETVRAGAERYTRQSAERGSRLYDRAADMARGVRIKPTNTLQAVDAAIARLRQNPAASQSDIASLEAFRSRIEGAVSIQGLRDARTTLSQGVYDGRLRSGADQAMWKGILGNVADDIDAGLRSVGRENAANAFRQADKFWSERVEFIDQALQPILGRDGTKGGEEVLQAIEGMARGQRGGNARLSRVMSALSPQEAGNVRATLVDRLGKARPGSQDAQGEAFSPATFLTNWNKMTPQAKASIFPDKATRDNLNDLALIAERTKAGQSMANTSNTGIAVNTANVIGGGAVAYANPVAALLGAGSLLITGRLMASPGFARLLARTAKMPPEAANRTFREQLGVLATREPALQGDVNSLLQAMNDNGPRLAADGNNEQQQ